MNIYLTKIASRTDSVLNYVMGYGDRLIGSSARKFVNQANVLKNAPYMGIHNIPAGDVQEAHKLAKQHVQESLNTRIKTGIGLAVAGGTGYMGIHKAQQHNDNKIMQRILNDAANRQY